MKKLVTKYLSFSTTTLRRLDNSESRQGGAHISISECTTSDWRLIDHELARVAGGMIKADIVDRVITDSDIDLPDPATNAAPPAWTQVMAW